MPTKTDVLPKLEAKVRIHHADTPRAQLLAFAELRIADAFVIKDIRILRVKGQADEVLEPFVSFPNKKGTGENQDRYYDIAHPVTAEAYKRAVEAILRAYEKAESAASGL